MPEIPVPDEFNRYGEPVHIDPSVNLRDFVENGGMSHNTVVVLAPGTYTQTGYINYPWHNTHWFAEDASYMSAPLTPRPASLVRIRAGFRFHGAQEFRATGIDFLTQADVANFYAFQGTYFLSDVYMTHVNGSPAPWPGGGGAISSYGGGFSFDCVLRNCDINHASEAVSGTPIKMKDGGYLRMTASTNGWKPRVFFGAGAGIQCAGVPSYLHDVDIFGPGESVLSSTGLYAHRPGGHIFHLKSLGSPQIADCGSAVVANSAGRFTLRGTRTTPLDIRRCRVGINLNDAGEALASSRTHLRIDKNTVRTGFSSDPDSVYL